MSEAEIQSTEEFTMETENLAPIDSELIKRITKMLEITSEDTFQTLSLMLNNQRFTFFSKKDLTKDGNICQLIETFNGKPEATKSELLIIPLLHLYTKTLNPEDYNFADFVGITEYGLEYYDSESETPLIINPTLGISIADDSLFNL